MKKYYLNYYPLFSCTNLKCKHTCCKGWEMYIDKNTLQKYKTDTSNFSTILKKGIDFKKGKFKWKKDKRCAFLNDNGLCDIFSNLGENSLCDICKDHPRFKSYFSDRVEVGLGFCCEEATRIILSYKDKINLTLVSDDKIDEELDFREQNILDFREKALSIIQDRKTNINDRITNLLKECNAEFLDSDFKKVLKTISSFERFDKNFKKRIKDIDKYFSSAAEEQLSLCAEQFLVNSIYRHLSDAEDTLDVRARTITAVLSWFIVKSIYLKEKGLENDFLVLFDVIRAYSVEVEYSTKNLNKLISLSYNYIKI